MAKSWKFWQGHPKPAFSKKRENGGLTTAPQVPEWQSYYNFWKVTQNPHFLKKCEWQTKRNFSKIAQKEALASKGQQDSGANVIIL